MAKEKKVCPECGKSSWTSTRKGARCRNCGYLDASIRMPATEDIRTD